MTISVLVVTYNRCDDVCDLLASLRCQTRPPDEVVVVDNCSTDDTRERVPSMFPEIRTIFLSRNLGGVEGRNAAARNASGDVLVFVDSDAVLEQRALEFVQDVLERDSSVNAVAFRALEHGTETVDRSTWAWRNVSPEHHGVPRQVLFFVGVGFAVRRCLWEQVGGFYGSLVYGGEEMDFCLRAAGKRARVRYEPRIVVRHKGSPTGRATAWRAEFYRIRASLWVAIRNLPPRDAIEWLVPETLGVLLRSVYQPTALAALVLAVLSTCRQLPDLVRTRQPVRGRVLALYRAESRIIPRSRLGRIAARLLPWRYVRQAPEQGQNI